jgi:hypothetical protein
VWVEKYNSIAGSKTREIGEMIYGIETQAETSSFSDFQLLDGIPNIADAFKIAVREHSIVEHQQARALKVLKRV